MPIFLIAGSKGGVGCTTIAVNLALALATPEARVLLINATRREDAALLCGTTAFRSSAHLARQLPHLGHDALFGYLALERYRLNAVTWDAAAPEIWSSILPRYDAVVIDGGSDSRRTRPLWRWITHWGGVATVDPCALAGLESLMAVWRDLFVPRHRMAVLCNRCGEQPLIASTLFQERFPESEIFVVADDREAVGAAIEGVPLVQRPVLGPLAKSITPLVQTWRAWPAVHAAMACEAITGSDDIAATPQANPPANALRSAMLQAMHQRLEGHEHCEASKVRETLQEIIAAWPATELLGIDRCALLTQLCDEAMGLGPLESLWADDQVSEILINGPDDIFCERNGQLLRVEQTFRDADHVQQLVHRLLLPTGRRVDVQSPIVDARLPDGSRINVVLPPLSWRSPVVTIRRFGRRPWTIDRLCEAGALRADGVALLRHAVAARQSLLIIGGTGSGKTTLLNALSGMIPPQERIVTIEDAAELQLQQPHVVGLQARPANLEGVGEITIRDLVRTALRMRPDRIIVGECRGAEALDMLQAMNTGHEGALTTLHANSPEEAIGRLATLVCYAGYDLPLNVIYRQIDHAIDWIVQIVRCSNGRRIVARICELIECTEGRVTLRTHYEQGDDAGGHRDVA